MAEEIEVEVQPEPSDFSTHMRNAGNAFYKQWASLIPDDFWKYGKEARKEFILGLQAGVDTVIDTVEGSAKSRGSTTGPTKAKVQVD